MIASAPDAHEPASADVGDSTARSSLDDELDERSSIRLLGDVLTTALEATRDTAELTAALVREELEGFSSDVAKRVIAVAIGAVGFALTTVGFVLGLKEWFLPWSLSFLVVGALDMGIAWWIARTQRNRPTRESGV